MSNFHSTPKPAYSIWGEPHHAVEIVPGIWQVDTAGHGGLILSEERQAAMPKCLRMNENNYEEDCNWALPVIAFEQEIRSAGRLEDIIIQHAHDTAKCWHPDKYSAFSGIEVTEVESPILKRRNAYMAAIGKICVTSSWGDCAEWVPKGKVGVCGQKLISVCHLGYPVYGDDEIYGLCDKGDYDRRDKASCFDDLNVEIIDVAVTRELPASKQVAL